MGYNENEYILLSALQHYQFCPKQCALIHVEQLWSENIFTALGRLMHEKVHETKYEKRTNMIISRSLKLFSKELGISGQTDVVEFHRAETDDNSCKLSGFSGWWKPFPVEYKRGKPKRDQSDETQLCAQAICLEEMLGITIHEGAIFYGKNRRRTPVEFTEDLRNLTRETSENIHALFKAGITPKADYSKKCISCSLIDQCLPQKTGENTKASRYLKNKIGQFL